jgi:hypothetical protein
VIVAVGLLLCGGIATAGIMVTRTVAGKAREAVTPLTDPAPPTAVPDRPTEMPNLPGLPTPTTGLGGQTINVTYEIAGDGPAEILYVDELGSAPKRLDNVSLPWKFTTSMQTPALVSVTAMRIDTTEGRISCRALVDGAEVKKSTSAAGNVATASCTYFALD